jgi:hypothetical protein
MPLRVPQWCDAKKVGPSFVLRQAQDEECAEFFIVSLSKGERTMARNSSHAVVVAPQ